MGDVQFLSRKDVYCFVQGKGRVEFEGENGRYSGKMPGKWDSKNVFRDDYVLKDKYVHIIS